MFNTLSEGYPRHRYFRFLYSLKVPFPSSIVTATLVLEQTSGEGCFDERPKL
jgi:hypothetical protein